MDPATAVAGCGPAFVYQMIEAMADAGVGLGTYTRASLADGGTDLPRSQSNGPRDR